MNNAEPRLPDALGGEALPFAMDTKPDDFEKYLVRHKIPFVIDRYSTWDIPETLLILTGSYRVRAVFDTAPNDGYFEQIDVA